MSNQPPSETDLEVFARVAREHIKKAIYSEENIAGARESLGHDPTEQELVSHYWMHCSKEDLLSRLSDFRKVMPPPPPGPIIVSLDPKKGSHPVTDVRIE